MARIPAPRKIGDCRSIGGITICPHAVHLTPAQMKTVQKMHERNVASLQGGVRKAKKTTKKPAKRMPKK